MTVNSFYYQKPSTAQFLPKINTNFNIKKVKRFSKSYLTESIEKNKKAFASIAWIISIVLFSIIASTFIYFQSVNGDLDYRITEAKNKLKDLEIENAELKTNLVKNISPDYIVKWAQENGFVKNNNFSHYDIGQVKVLSLNTHN